MRNPKVTVIIPTYNRAKTLKNAIESALNQTYANLEIIVIDDGSTDNTKEIMKAYANKVNYIQKANTGKSHSRNIGLAAATGSIVAPLDSDDVWHNDYLQKSVKCLQENKLDMFFSNWEQNSFHKSLLNLKETPYLFAYDEFRKIILNHCPAPSSGVIFKKESIRTGWINEAMAYEDWLLEIEGVLRKTISRIGFTHEVLWQKNDNEANIQKRKSVFFWKNRSDATLLFSQMLDKYLTKTEKWQMNKRYLKDKIHVLMAKITNS